MKHRNSHKEWTKKRGLDKVRIFSEVRFRYFYAYSCAIYISFKHFLVHINRV